MEKYEYWLDSCPGIGDKSKDALLQVTEHAREIYEMSEKLLSSILDERRAGLLSKHKESWDLDEEFNALQNKGIRFVSVNMEDYPRRLRNISDPPYALYVKGKLPEEEKLSVAVIGARDCSEYGEYVARALGKMLGEQGISLISGMARGIDGISQMAALDSGGVSFGVLGSGVDVCYPKRNRALYDRLLKKGGILSTYLPGTEPRATLFPPRNRIVSGLCDVLVVIEARQRSGTSITVEMALEQGKDVYAVPGRLTDRLSDGCNRLLKDGAQIFLSPKEFVEELAMRYGKKFSFEAKGTEILIPGGEKFTPQELAVYDALDLYPMPIENIVERLKKKKTVPEMDFSQIMITLMGLCVKGCAVQNSSGWFSKSV